MLDLPLSVQQHYFPVLAVREEVSRLRGSAAYSRAAESLLGVLYDGLARLADDFANLASDTEGTRRTAARYGQVASVLHDCLQFVQGSDEDQAPSSLVEPLETLARVYMPNCQLLVRSSFQGGLAAYWTEFFVPSLRTLLEGLPGGGPLAKRLDQFVSLVFPSAQRENLLMHAILGHELGHAFSYNLKITEQLSVPIPQEVNEQLSKLEDRDREAFRQIVLDWLEELVGDAWGLHIMGPAFYFASSAALSQTPPSTTHPAGRFRLQSLRQHLEWRGYLGAGEDAAKWLRGYVAAEAAAAGMAVPLFQLAEAALGAFTRSIFDAVRVLQPENAFTPAKFGQVAEGPVNRLCNLVPPDQTDGGPTRMPDVLNAGWLVWLRRWEQFCQALGVGSDPDRRFDALAKLNSLLLKALEYSAIRIHWSAQ